MKRLIFLSVLMAFAIPIAISAEVDNNHLLAGNAKWDRQIAQEGCSAKEEPKKCPPPKPKEECNKCQPPKPKCPSEDKCKKCPPKKEEPKKCAPSKPKCDS